MRLASARSLGGAILAGCVMVTSTAGAQGPILSPVSIGIAGGVAVPTGHLADGTASGFAGVNTGFNVTGSVGVGLPFLPFSLRGEASYNGFDAKSARQATVGEEINADVRVVNVTANIVLPVHLPVPTMVLSPYLIGGIGKYNVRFSPATSGSISSSNFGFNIGAGVKIPMIVFDAFVEARYHRVNQSNGYLAFVPITVGVMF